MLAIKQYLIKNNITGETFKWCVRGQDRLRLKDESLYSMELVKSLILPTYVFFNEIACIRISDLERFFGNQVAEAFTKFMAHQTAPIIPDIPDNEQDFCYLGDLDNFLRPKTLRFWD